MLDLETSPPSPQPSPAPAGEGGYPLSPFAGRGLGRGEYVSSRLVMINRALATAIIMATGDRNTPQAKGVGAVDFLISPRRMLKLFLLGPTLPCRIAPHNWSSTSRMLHIEACLKPECEDLLDSLGLWAAAPDCYITNNGK